MSRSGLLLIALLLCLLMSGVVSNNPLLLKLRQQFANYVRNNPQEKVYLHLDKKQATLGDTIWFKVYLVDALWHEETTPSSLVYVELIDPKNQILETKYIYAGHELAGGDFQIPADSMPGNYTIRAYTNYMRNFHEDYFFRQQIQVWNAYSELDKDEKTNQTATTAEDIPHKQTGSFQVRFFPEGGALVNGLSSRVAFKITGINGKNKEVEARIYDNDHKLLTNTPLIRRGMGFFKLHPESGKSYYAEFNCAGETAKFPIPQALQKGYQLQVNNRASGKLSVIMRTNIKNGFDGAFVIGHMKGQIICTIEGIPKVMRLEGQLSSTELPDGIAQFTLFNPQGDPVCERLVFIQNPQNQVDVEIKTDKNIYNSREEVKIELAIRDADLNGVAANLSFSVIDMATVPADSDGKNIKSYLLLGSELKGHIDHLAYYLDGIDSERRYLLDLLMMTHGWRRFVWKKIINDVRTPWDYLPEKGITIKGITTQLDKRDKPIASQVSMSLIDSDGFHMEDQTTDADGIFHFKDVHLVDSTDVILQGNIFNRKKIEKRLKKDNEKGVERFGPQGNRFVSIFLQEQDPPPINPLYGVPMFSLAPTSYLANRRQINQLDSIYRDLRTINLEEIVILGRKPAETHLPWYDNHFGNPTHRIVLDSLPYLSGHMTVIDLIRDRIPGVAVYGTGMDQYLILRGATSLTGDNSALILLDGISIDSYTAASLYIYDVSAIEIFKGPAAAIFGGRGGGGVIVIHSRIGGSNLYTGNKTTGIIHYKHPGFYKVREFYSPDYSWEKPEHQKPDFRTTLYWNHHIKSDSTGARSISFFTSDKNSDYQILVEGITLDGIPVHQEMIVKVR